MTNQRDGFEKWCAKEHYFVEQDGVQAAWNASRAALIAEIVGKLSACKSLGLDGDKIYIHKAIEIVKGAGQ